MFQHAYARALAAARTQVAELDWATAWAAGRVLTAAQVVAEALGETDKSGHSGERLLFGLNRTDSAP